RLPYGLFCRYAWRGMVNHTVLGSTSALKLFEQNWRLPALTSRDASAADLIGACDFTAPGRASEVIATGAAWTPLPSADVKRIYWFYGGAVLSVLLLVAAAVGLPPAVAIRCRRTRRADGGVR